MKRDELSENDAREIERFVIYLRAVNQCKLASVGQHEACHAIAADVYGNKYADEPTTGEDNGS